MRSIGLGADPRNGRIGFVGLGRMGAPMCANLVRAGCRVAATDIRPDAPTGGARRVGTTADLAAEVDMLITMPPGSQEVVTAMEGGLAALPPGAVWIGSDFIRRDLDALFAGDYLETFGLDRVGEELAAVTSLAHELDVPFTLSDQVYQTYQRALARYGPVDGELSAVALLEEETGLRLRDRPGHGV